MGVIRSADPHALKHELQGAHSQGRFPLLSIAGIAVTRGSQLDRAQRRDLDAARRGRLNTMHVMRCCCLPGSLPAASGGLCALPHVAAARLVVAPPAPAALILAGGISSQWLSIIPNVASIRLSSSSRSVRPEQLGFRPGEACTGCHHFG